MTRNEAKKLFSKCKSDFIIDKIYDNFEEREIFLATKDLCSDKCKHYLSDNGNYPLEPCGSCTRFYADMFEDKES